MSGETVCAVHGDVIIHEPGGPEMPTIHGRDYCPACQDRFMAILDALGAEDDET